MEVLYDRASKLEQSNNAGGNAQRVHNGVKIAKPQLRALLWVQVLSSSFNYCAPRDLEKLFGWLDFVKRIPESLMLESQTRVAGYFAMSMRGREAVRL